MTTDIRIRGKAYKDVGGLVFFPDKHNRQLWESAGYSVYPRIESWITAGCPDKSVVHDYAGVLVDTSIPIVDSVYRHGIYHKVQNFVYKGLPATVYSIRPLAKEAKMYSKFEMEILDNHGVTMVDAEVSKASSGHGKMTRGGSHRKAKK